MITIDAHQHFWNPARGDYSWMPEDNKILFQKDLSSDGHIKIPNQYLKGSGGFAPEIVIISSEIVP